ncbi:carboxymuconolactone decarboxylase family protein [Francisella sp. 19X1-34]|uniref:carboxymuconolactone decarboxylase family protein n=1 Tax=Francisella sp. 19X1-34 TaxID=3087177 RepID=UPI002E37DDF3|nr:carboxymuconolactone decarboxylase family protein [Francisella sp. 19X1-34]MED7787789.1 carboxymuconolactone decarboxylase family protein [Francisella sp. 19X1-34]
MILIDIKYIKELKIVDNYKDEHIKYLSTYYDKELILASGPYNERQGGFIISNMGFKQANEYVKNDPYYINNIGVFEIKEFKPTRVSNDFKLLINSPQYSKNGRELFDQLHGEHAGEQLINALSKVSPDFSELTFNFAFEKIFARNSQIPMLTKELITIAICCAIGDCNAQVKSHIDAAINIGASKKMIIETLLLVTPFAGFPRVANTLLSIADDDFNL